jgi:hypothetical protein
MLVAICLSHMKSSLKLLLVLTAATAFFVVQPVKASPTVQGGPSSTNGAVPVSDAGSTLPLLGSALLAVAALRRKLSR